MYKLKTYTYKLPPLWMDHFTPGTYRQEEGHRHEWEELRKADTITEGANFYIQLKGDHSGRPMKTPIKNCTQVITKNPHLYQLCSMLWRGGLFRQKLRGTCCPFITHRDIKIVLNYGGTLNPSSIEAGAELLQSIDNAITSHQTTINKLGELRKAATGQILNNKPIKPIENAIQ
jgi:hypothetical protein